MQRKEGPRNTYAVGITFDDKLQVRTKLRDLLTHYRGLSAFPVLTRINDLTRSTSTFYNQMGELRIECGESRFKSYEILTMAEQCNTNGNARWEDPTSRRIIELTLGVERMIPANLAL